MNNLNAKFTRAELYGKVLNISTENETSKFNSEALKSITSGDPIQIENKYERPFTAKLTTKLVFAMNTLPTPTDKTFALFRRLCIVPFLTKFVDNPHDGTNELKRNPNIENELVEELPGILAWSIEGLKRLVANDYQFTKSIEAEKLMLEYRKDVTPVFTFIEECIAEDTRKNRSTKFPRLLDTKLIFDTYNHWLITNRMKIILSKREFLRQFREGLKEFKIPFEEPHSGNSRYFRGICLVRDIKRKIDYDAPVDMEDYTDDDCDLVEEDDDDYE